MRGFLWKLAMVGVWAGGMAGGAAGGINLVPNASFEHGLPLKQQVYDWTPAPEFPEAEYTWDDQEKHTGERSLRIRNSLKADGTWANAGWASPAFPAFSGIRYTFSAWIKTSTTAGHTHLVMAWFNDQHQWLGNSDNGFFLRGLNDWLQVSVSDFPPEGAAYGRAYFRSDGNGAMAWCDDVQLSLSEETEAKILVPNASFEAVSQEWPDGWEAEGDMVGAVPCARPDESLAHSGQRCVALTDAVSESAWMSPAFYLHASRRSLYRFSAWVNAEELEEGEVSLGIRWEDGAGRVSEAEGDAVPAGQVGWVEVAVEAAPPEGALCGRLVLRGRDVVGTVRFDDVALRVRPAERKVLPAPAVPLGVAVARCYAAHVVSPDRLQEHFQETFPQAEDVERVLADVEGYVAAQPEAIDDELRWVLGILRYHAGRYAEALETLQPLHRAYSTLDLRNDLIWHYEYWAEEGKKEQERRVRLQALDDQAQAMGDGSSQEQVRTWQQVADGYYEAQAFEQAARAYQRLEQVAVAAGESDCASYAAYRMGVARCQAGDYGGAIEALKAFLQEHAESEWQAEASFWLGESLRRQGQPREAIGFLKPLWEQKPTGGLAQRVDRSLTQCYVVLREDAALVEEYKRLFGRLGLPGVVYLGEDLDTKGDWGGRYGTYAYVLCGMRQYDLVGGPGWPVAYRISTSDPAEPSRRYMAEHLSDNPNALFDPSTRKRTLSYRDDRGETHPFDSQGPNLIVHLRVPPGLFVVSFYMAEHEITVQTSEGETLATLPRRNTAELKYQRFLVQGPLDLRATIWKGESLCALLPGIFLDRFVLPTVRPPWAQETISVQEVPYENLAAYLQRVAQNPLVALTEKERYAAAGRELNRLLESGSVSPGSEPAVAWLLFQWESVAATPHRREAAWRTYLQAMRSAHSREADQAALLGKAVQWALNEGQEGLAAVGLEEQGQAAAGTLAEGEFLEKLAALYVRLGRDKEAAACYQRLANLTEGERRQRNLLQWATLCQVIGAGEEYQKVLKQLADGGVGSAEADLAAAFLGSLKLEVSAAPSPAVENQGERVE